MCFCVILHVLLLLVNCTCKVKIRFKEGSMVVAIYKTVLISFIRRVVYKNIEKYPQIKRKIYGFFFLLLNDSLIAKQLIA